MKARQGNAVTVRGSVGSHAETAQSTASESESEFVTLARVAKTQGRHGEVAAEVHSDVPDRFAAGMRLLALDKAGASRRQVEIENLWPHKSLLVLKFIGIDSISDAEALVGAELQVRGRERAPLEPGWTYVSDLMGCTVFDHGRELGRIEDVQFGAGEAPLLVVSDSAGKKYDVPFAQAYVQAIEASSHEVRMQLPEGMLEINAPMTPEEKRQQREKH
jgi:16S rRNA processing protein RimM